MGRNGAITGSRCEGRPGWVHGVASSTQPGALPLGTAERHAQRTPIQAAVRGLSYMGFDYEIRGGPAKLTPRGPPLIVRKMCLQVPSDQSVLQNGPGRQDIWAAWLGSARTLRACASSRLTSAMSRDLLLSLRFTSPCKAAVSSSIRARAASRGSGPGCSLPLRSLSNSPCILCLLGTASRRLAERL